jgi:site-specific DNA recombinase
MRARILLRNSTDRQARAGTIAAQRGPVRQLAARLGATDLIEYVEEAVSGAAPLDERDVLRRLLAEAQPGDLVCAFDMSRLTRSDDWIERYTVFGHLRRAKLKPATVDDGEINLDTIGGRITAHIKGEIADDERKKILARVTAGKVAAVQQGRKPQGATPYGLRYDRTARAWSIDEERAGIVRGIFARLIAGETCATIAARLTSTNAPPIRTEGWTARKVWHLATRSTYRGEWRFDGAAIAVPAIVDLAAWQEVQARLLASKRRGLRRTQHVYLLDEGHGRCGVDGCGAPLRLHWGGRTARTPYYVCGRRKAGGACSLPWWRTEEADGLVWQEVTRILARPDLVEEAVRERGRDETIAAVDVAGFEAHLSRLAGVRSVLTAQFRRGRIDEGELDRELDAVDRERRMIEQSIAAARTAAERARTTIAEIGTVRAYLVDLREAADAATPEERRMIVRALAPSVTLDADRVRIGFRLHRPEPIALVGSTCWRRESHCATDLTVERVRKAG